MPLTYKISVIILQKTQRRAVKANRQLQAVGVCTSADVQTVTVHVFVREAPELPDTNTTSHNVEGRLYRIWVRGSGRVCAVYRGYMFRLKNKPSSGLP